MKIENKNILLISPENWDHIFVSKHHYAIHLGKRDNQVFFLNPPSNKMNYEKTDFENVFSVEYTGFLKGLRHLPTFLRKVWLRKKLKEIEALIGVNIDIIWSFDNSVFYDFSAFDQNKIFISHIVDYNQDFMFKKASTSANYCFSTSQAILEKQLKYNPNSYNIGHGFNEIKSPNTSLQLKGSNKVSCGYAGNLDISYLDWTLIIKLVIGFPEIDFHFVGPWIHQKKHLEIFKLANFHYLGKLKSEDLPAFYEKVDILLILYKYLDFPEQLSNPHKMLEYLGAGKMVIATWTEEYRHLHEAKLLKLVKNSADFKTELSLISSELNMWNSDQAQKSRVKYAEAHSYNKQIKKIEEIIK